MSNYQNIGGRRIVLVDVMDTIISPCSYGNKHDIRSGASEFFSWCNSHNVAIGVHSDIDAEDARKLLERLSPGVANYVWGRRYIGTPTTLPSGRVAVVKSFSRMLYEARCSPEDSLVISDGDVDAARIAGIDLICVPNFGMEELTGDKFDFRELIPA